MGGGESSLNSTSKELVYKEDSSRDSNQADGFEHFLTPTTSLSGLEGEQEINEENETDESKTGENFSVENIDINEFLEFSPLPDLNNFQLFNDCNANSKYFLIAEPSNQMCNGLKIDYNANSESPISSGLEVKQKTEEEINLNNIEKELNLIVHDATGIFPSFRTKSDSVIYSDICRNFPCLLGDDNNTKVPKLDLPVKEIEEERKCYPEDSYLMVSQLHWEDDVIWDADNIKDSESLHNMTAWVFDLKSRTFIPKTRFISKDQCKKDAWFSIFPVENQELLYGQWENEIIWDAEELRDTFKPKILTLDPNDENIIIEIPEDIYPRKDSLLGTNSRDKITKRKRKELGGQENAALLPLTQNPLNISNDIFYESRLPDAALKLKIGNGSLITHTTPVIELRAPFIQTHMSSMDLRNFHRPHLKQFSSGNLVLRGPLPVKPLSKYTQTKVKEQVCSSEDITSGEGDLILVEFSEEHPPFINQIGMCSQIKNYFKRKPTRDSGRVIYRYGKEAFVFTSPFLGVLHPGQNIQSLENHMYRAPIYEHKIPETDFLIIRSRNHYYIREIDALYCVGQLCPLYEIPEPNSKRATSFLRDFLQVFIYRLLWKSTDNPRRIKMEDVMKAFPSISENSIREQIKTCTKFERTARNSYWWVLKNDFRLPSEEEIREMILPEQYCAYLSMIAAKQRLKDAGYDEKCLFTPQENANEEMQLTVADEVKAAPWNTTRAFIRAMEGKCLLKLDGPADPTGCGEGFSYTERKSRQESQPNIDFQQLTLQNAKALLRKSGVPEAEIKNSSRWEVIQAARMLTAKKANADEKNSSKCSTNSKSSIAEEQNDYKKECQRIFDLQNHILSSAEVLTTDEDSSSDECTSDIEEMAKNIENILNPKIDSDMIKSEDNITKNKDLKQKFEQCLPEITQGRTLMIYRTLKNSEGQEITQIEIVRQAPVINAYLKIRSRNDEELIKPYLKLSQQQIEEIHQERRFIQKQLSRIKPYKPKIVSTNLQKQFKTSQNRNVLFQRRIKPKTNIRFKCSRCGNIGHIKTNRTCPLYQKLASSHNLAANKKSKLINVDSTKIKISGKVLKSNKKTKTCKRKNYNGIIINNDYRKPSAGQINRRRKDPAVLFSNILITILNEMRDMPNAEPFLVPVNKFSSHYHTIVQKPIDLHTIREKLRQNKYQKRQEFLVDVNQIVENSKLFNGSQSYLTIAAENMLKRCSLRITEKEEILMQLEKEINPLLDDNALVALAFIFDNIINNNLKTIPQARPFLFPVSKTVIFYYDIIKKPMDLGTISKKVAEQKYHNRIDFLEDVKQIYKNSELYNGKASHFTNKAEFIVNICRESLEKYSDHLSNLEERVSLQEQSKMDLSGDSNSCANVIAASESDNKLRKRKTEDLLVSSGDEMKKPRLNDKSNMDLTSDMEILNDLMISESDETANSDNSDYLDLWF